MASTRFPAQFPCFYVAIIIAEAFRNNQHIDLSPEQAHTILQKILQNLPPSFTSENLHSTFY